MVMTSIMTIEETFGLIAVENGRRFAIQQDWLGMCRIFTAEAGGVTVFASRPLGSQP